MNKVTCPLASELTEQYVKNGWSVVALRPKDKKPLNDWKAYQTKRADLEEIFSWLEKYDTEANVGICTGQSSGIVVVDIDNECGQAIVLAMGLPNTSTVRTARGNHYYFNYSGSANGRILKTRVDNRMVAILEVRASGQYVVAPPSIHPSGVEYKWENGHSITEMANTPDWVQSYLEGGKNKTLEKVKTEMVKLWQTDKGARNDQLNKAAYTLGKLIKQKKLDRANVEEALLFLGTDVGLPEREVEATVTSGLDAGIKKATQAQADSTNIISALNNLGYDFQVNVLNDDVEVNGVRIDDLKKSEIRTAMRDLSYKSMSPIEDAYTAHAAKHKYHPIQDYLLGLEWDEEDHLSSLAELVTVNHPPVEDERYVNLFHLWLTKWMLGSVDRVFAQEQNFMLVLEGPQNVGKSFFVKWLASGVSHRYFAAAPVYPGNKDWVVRLIETWVWEVGELGATIRAQDREALKAFITLEYVKVRKPFGHYDIVKPALASFVGTLNDIGGFLDDPTGNRRFAVVSIRNINWSYSNELSPDQLWAQVMDLYHKGERGKLSVEEVELRDALNESFEAPSPLGDDLDQLFIFEEGNTNIAMHTYAIQEILQSRGYRKSKALAMELAGLLKKRGAVKAPSAIDIDGVRARGYYGIRPRLLEKKIVKELRGMLWED